MPIRTASCANSFHPFSFLACEEVSSFLLDSFLACEEVSLSFFTSHSLPNSPPLLVLETLFQSFSLAHNLLFLPFSSSLFGRYRNSCLCHEATFSGQRRMSRATWWPDREGGKKQRLRRKDWKRERRVMSVVQEERALLSPSSSSSQPQTWICSSSGRVSLLHNFRERERELFPLWGKEQKKKRSKLSRPSSRIHHHFSRDCFYFSLSLFTVIFPSTLLLYILTVIFVMTLNSSVSHPHHENSSMNRNKKWSKKRQRDIIYIVSFQTWCWVNVLTSTVVHSGRKWCHPWWKKWWKWIYWVMVWTKLLAIKKDPCWKGMIPMMICCLTRTSWQSPDSGSKGFLFQSSWWLVFLETPSPSSSWQGVGCVLQPTITLRHLPSLTCCTLSLRSFFPSNNIPTFMIPSITITGPFLPSLTWSRIVVPIHPYGWQSPSPSNDSSSSLILSREKSFVPNLDLAKLSCLSSRFASCLWSQFPLNGCWWKNLIHSLIRLTLQVILQVWETIRCIKPSIIGSQHPSSRSFLSSFWRYSIPSWFDPFTFHGRNDHKWHKVVRVVQPKVYLVQMEPNRVVMKQVDRREYCLKVEMDRRELCLKVVEWIQVHPSKRTRLPSCWLQL